MERFTSFTWYRTPWNPVCAIGFSLGYVPLLQRAQLDAPVGGAAVFRLVVGDRAVLSVAAGGEPVGGNALRDEIGPYAFGASLRQLLVRRRRAAVVGMAGDFGADLGALLERGDDLIQHACRFGSEARRVRREVHALEHDHVSDGR